MQLVISIVSWNTADLLRRCLTTLLPYCRANHTRVVVIDNASSDGTPEMIRREFPTVTVIDSGANLGFGRAHNLIAQHSSEPYVLFLNPDTEFVEPAHEAMIDVMTSHPDVALVGCRMINLDGSVQPLGIQRPTSPGLEFLSGLLASRRTMPLAERLLPFHNPEEDGFVRKLYGGCLMARREILDRIGWFDDRFFMYGEDVDLSRRAENAGYKLYYLASAKVIHLCGGASAKAPGRFATLMQCESIAKLMDKYYGRWGRFRYTVTVFLRSAVRLIVLGAARLLSPKYRRARLIDSWRKNYSALRWSLNLEKAVIPK